MSSRILQVVTQMEAGGAQRIALWLNEAFAATDDDCELWFIYRKRYIETTGRIRVLSEYRPSGIAGWLGAVGRIFGALRAHRPDVLITHTYYSSILLQPLAWLLGVRVRIAVHHNPLNTYPALAKPLDALLGSVGCYTRSVAVSRTVWQSAQSYNRRYLEKTVRITNGLPLERVNGVGRDNQQLRRRLGVDEGQSLLVNVGRLSEVKNQMFLLGVVARLPDVVLCLVGDGELRQELQREVVRLGIAERVVFLGEVPYEEAMSAVAAADIFVFPSIYESMGLALVEAMLLRKPVVASNIEAANEFLGGGGVLLDLEQEGWVAALQDLIARPEERLRLGARGAEQAKTYSIDSMVAQYRALFR